MIETLQSGLRVCTIPMHGVETASLMLLVDRGSRHEPGQLNGIAHLFEHMVFKGAASRSAREISEAIEDVGGDLNACTERDSTSFNASVLAEHVPLAIELLSDLVVRSHLAAGELEREKQVVLQELAEAWDTPSDIIFDELWATAFADQPIGRSILGTRETIAAITASDLVSWREQHYRGGSLILAAAGKVEPNQIAELAERHFGGLALGCGPAASDAPVFTGGNRVGRVPSEQAHLTFAFEGPAATATDFYAARIFADVVGGGSSSRLFQEVREERGLAYSVSAALQSYRETGIFYLHAATARADGAAAAQLVREVIEAAAQDLSERELQRAKNQARAGLLMHLESSWGQASYASRQIATFGRVRAPGEVVAEIMAVTLDEVRAAGAKMLAGPMARATIGMPAVRAA